MKNYAFIILLFFYINNLYTQENLNFGSIIGFNAYDIKVNGPLNGGTGYSGFNIGGFADYKLNQSYGVKANFIYSTIKEVNYMSDNGQNSDFVFEKVESHTIQVQSLLKYDLNKEYNRGFYLVSGLRITNVLNAKGDGINIKDFYKEMHFGAMFGFGIDFAKHFAFELIPEYNLSNTLESNQFKSLNFGVYFNLTINFKSLINELTYRANY